MLALSIGLLTLLAVFAVLAIQIWVTRQNTFDLLNQKAAFILNRVESDIRGYLGPVEEQVDFIARQIEGGNYDISDTEYLLPLLTGALAPLPQVDRIVVMDPSLIGLVVRRLRDGDIAYYEGDRRQIPGGQKAIERLRTANRSVWGGLVHRKGETYASLQRPIRRGGEIVGFIAAAISTTELSRLTAETGALLSTSLEDGTKDVLATAFILYGRDRVLAHPYLVGTAELRTPQTPALRIDEIGDDVVASLWTGVRLPGFDKAAAGDVNVVGIALGDSRYVAIYKWIVSFGDVPWAVGVWAQASDLDAEIRRLDKAALGGLAVALLAAIAAIGVGGLLARPIQAVSESAMKVGDFDLDEIENLPRSRIRELDDEATAFNRMLAGLRSFETYVPRALVARLIRAGSAGAVTSEQRRVTVMFTDIVSYTAAAENLTAAEVASFLNEHFSLLGACVEAEEGTIDKYIGDSLMAFWGAPEAQSETERRACRAALAIADAVAAANRTRAGRGQPPVRLRVGIHTGEVVVGNIGAPGRINYTVVGDAVNSCQRLEGLGKEIDPAAEVIVLISDVTAAALDGSFALRSVGEFAVEGRMEPLEVFRLTG